MEGFDRKARYEGLSGVGVRTAISLLEDSILHRGEIQVQDQIGGLFHFQPMTSMILVWGLVAKSAGEYFR
jgi:hypothetical protein